MGWLEKLNRWESKRKRIKTAARVIRDRWPRVRDKPAVVKIFDSDPDLVAVFAALEEIESALHRER